MYNTILLSYLGRNLCLPSKSRRRHPEKYSTTNYRACVDDDLHFLLGPPRLDAQPVGYLSLRLEEHHLAGGDDAPELVDVVEARLPARAQLHGGVGLESAAKVVALAPGQHVQLRLLQLGGGLRTTVPGAPSRMRPE